MKNITRSTRHSQRTRLFWAGTLAALIWLLSPRLAYALVQRQLSTPTLAITSPVYQQLAQGPVGTNVTVQATTGWTTGATIVLSVEPGLVPPDGECDQSKEIPINALQPIQVDSKGGFTGNFAWPSGASQSTTYIVCANEQGSGSQSGATTNTFTVDSANPPAIALSTQTANGGDQITVSGTNWLPGGQTISFQLQSGQQLSTPLTTAAAVLSDASGNFQTTLTLPTDRVGPWTVVATSGTVQTINNTPVAPLQATSKSLTISAAPTPTTAPTATIAPTATTKTSTVVTPTPGSPQNQTLLVLLLALIAIVLLGAGVVVAILALRGRNLPNDPNDPRWDDRSGGPAGYRGEDWNGPPNEGNFTQDWNGGWRNPAGQPWSGRGSRPYDGAGAGQRTYPPAYEEEEDPYRTRMGDPPQTPPAGPNQSRPNTSRPLGPPPPATRPPWDEGTDTNPQWPPTQRR